MNKKLLTFYIASVFLFVGFLFKDRILRIFYAPTNFSVKEGVTVNQVESEPQDNASVVENLTIPWELVFLPNGEMLITERPGNLLKIGKDRMAIKVDGVRNTGEGGLLGLVLHPNFTDNGYIYLYFTSSVSGRVSNRVVRYKLIDDSLSDQKIIVDGIPGAANHDGGRVKFGPDGLLYITTGDSQNSNLSQDINSLAGKILRVTDSGAIPQDNPFGNAVYSYGHRNVQGIAWDNLGRLWATEHGRSGIQSGLDEINLIEKGKNYGWPTIQGDQTQGGMLAPVINSGANETWAPSGIVFADGKLFWAGLRGESLYEAKINGSNLVNLKANFRQEFGRLRTVVVGPDGYFYILTNNTDGRGNPRLGDDKIIRVNPEIFEQS